MAPSVPAARPRPGFRPPLSSSLFFPRSQPSSRIRQPLALQWPQPREPHEVRGSLTTVGFLSGYWRPGTRAAHSIIEKAEHAAAAGDNASAKRLFREAAALQEQMLGANHPDLANTLNNLGVVCEMTDNPIDAEHYFRRVVTLRIEQSRGRVTNGCS
jgi:hypothetical protein